MGRTGRRLSYQVLQEYYVRVTSKLKPGLEAEAARNDVRALLARHPITVDAGVVEGAWVVQDRYGLSRWDAQIVAAAQVADCRFMLSEDLQDGQVLGAVRVVNPSSNSPDSILSGLLES